MTEEEKQQVWKAFCTGNYTIRGIENLTGVPKSTAHDFIVGKTHKSFPRDPHIPADIIQESVMPRILIFDIETTNLEADMFEMLMIGYQWFGEQTKPTVKTILDLPAEDVPWYALEKKDKKLVEYSVELINKADLVVFHNGKEFDTRYIQARAMIHKLRERGVIKPVPAIDTLEVSRQHLRLKGHSMGYLSKLLNLDEKKTGVGQAVWRRAMAHNKWAIEVIAEYCGQDINTQMSLFKEFLPLIAAHETDKKVKEILDAALISC